MNHEKIEAFITKYGLTEEAKSELEEMQQGQMRFAEVEKSKEAETKQTEDPGSLGKRLAEQLKRPESYYFR